MNRLEQQQRLIAELELSASSKLEKKILKEYKTANVKLKKMVSDLYEAYEKNGKVTYEEMAKYNRLLKMESKVKDVIKNMSRKNAKALFSDMFLLYGEVYGRIGYAIEKRIGRRLAYGALKSAKIQALIDAPLAGLKLTERLTTNRNTVYTNIKAELTRGFINGDSYGTVAKKLTDTLDGDATKAMRIVRTETHRAVTTAEQSGVDHARSKGIKMTKTWMTSKDERVRDSHKHMEGVTVDSEALFELGRGITCMAPGQTGVASEDINCRCLAKYEIVGFEDDVPDDGETYEEWAEERELPATDIPNYVRPENVIVQDGLNYEGIKDDNDEIKRQLNQLSSNASEFVNKNDIKFVLTSNMDHSGWDIDNKRILLIPGIQKGEVIHEIGHALEDLVFKNNKEFMELKEKHFGSIKISKQTDWHIFPRASQWCTGLDPDKYKFLVSDYQSYVVGDLSMNGERPKATWFREYLSEGYREYYDNPSNLKDKDPELYSIIEKRGL